MCMLQFIETANRGRSRDVKKNIRHNFRYDITLVWKFCCSQFYLNRRCLLECCKYVDMVQATPESLFNLLRFLFQLLQVNLVANLQQYKCIWDLYRNQKILFHPNFLLLETKPNKNPYDFWEHWDFTYERLGENFFRKLWQLKITR